jgi:arylsulfatase A-like enzyme
MIKSAELPEINFGADEKLDRKHLKKGWENLSGNKKAENAFRLTEGALSSLQFMLASISDIKIIFRCAPSTQENERKQSTEVFVNGNFLQKINFTKERDLRLNIPSTLLKHGTNSMIFNWRHPDLPIRFKSMKIQRNNTATSPQAAKTIPIASINEESSLLVPSGAILEYYINLPQDPVLKFGISNENAEPTISKAHVSVYNEDGEKISETYLLKNAESRKDLELKLKKFEKETVKIVFSNDISSDPNTAVSWIDPVISTSSQKSTLTLWNTENVESARLTSKEHKKTINGKVPNVFIYLADTVRADHLGVYKYRRETSPYLYKFSKDSLLFNNCYANASWTKAGVASILTGLYPNKHHGETEKDRVSDEAQFISEILRSNGYTTVYLTSNGNASHAFNFNQGNDFYKLVGKEERNQFYSSKFINSEFFQLIEDNPSLTEKPLFAYLHTIDPHDPYTPKAPFLKFVTFDKQRQNLRRVRNALKRKWSGRLNQKDLDYMMSLYDCEILHNDHSFGKFIEFLKSKDLYDNSMIIFVSDHGEQFHEHGNFRHGRSIYNEEIHVPLVIKFPNGEYSDTKSDVFVSQVDILPTILDYLGINTPPEVDGINILTLMNKPDIKRTIFVKEYNFRKSFAGFISPSEQTKHIIRYQFPDFDEILGYEQFDLQNDFQEKNSLYTNESPFSLFSIKFQADYLLNLINKTSMAMEEEVDLETLDPKTIEALKALGYLK